MYIHWISFNYEHGGTVIASQTTVEIRLLLKFLRNEILITIWISMSKIGHSLNMCAHNIHKLVFLKSGPKRKQYQSNTFKLYGFG